MQSRRIRVALSMLLAGTILLATLVVLGEWNAGPPTAHAQGGRVRSEWH